MSQFYAETGGSGAQGAQGATGVGAQGFQGFQGQAGQQGFQGFQGFQGDTGIGAQGSQGSQGFQGAIGTGSQGFQGFQGATGVGAQGFQGFQGLTGTGAQGFQGFQGATGTGVQGAQGFQGLTGTGAQGAQGFQGFQGVTGSGAQGAQGFQGASGAAQDTFSTVSAGGATQLTTNSNTLQIFTGTTAQTCRLPDTSTCTVGQVWRIESQNTTAGVGSVTIANSGGGTVFTSLSKNFWIQFQVVSTASNAFTSWSVSGNNTEIITSGYSSLAATSGAFQTLASFSVPPGSWILTGENCNTASATSTYTGVGINTTTGAFQNNFGFDTSYGAYSTTAQAGTAVVAAYLVTLTTATTYNLIARTDSTAGSHNGVMIAKRVY